MQKELSIYPNAGPICNPRLLVTSVVGLDEYRVEFQVFFKSIGVKNMILKMLTNINYEAWIKLYCVS